MILPTSMGDFILLKRPFPDLCRRLGRARDVLGLGGGCDGMKGTQRRRVEL